MSDNQAGRQAKSSPVPVALARRNSAAENDLSKYAV